MLAAAGWCCRVLAVILLAGAAQLKTCGGGGEPPQRARRELGVPAGEDHDGPQHPAVVGSTGAVGVEHSDHGRRVDHATEVGRPEFVAQLRTPRPPHPVAHRNREPQLGQGAHVGGQHVAGRRPQHLFGGVGVELHVHGDARGRIPHDPVQERNPQLQRVGHGQPVGLGEDVAGQPQVEVQVLHAAHVVHAHRLGVHGVGRGVGLGQCVGCGPGRSEHRCPGVGAAHPPVADVAAFERGGAPQDPVPSADVGRPAGSGGGQPLRPLPAAAGMGRGPVVRRIGGNPGTTRRRPRPTARW